MIEDIWKPIPTLENRYWVSSNGQVKSKFNRILKCNSNKGQKCVSIVICGKSKVFEVRHLMAYAFLGADIRSNTKPKLVHIDGDFSNINLDNLQLADYSDLAEEEWRDISGFESVYQVSNLGRVKRLPRVDTYIRKDTGKHCVRHVGEIILKPIHSSEYDEVDLCVNSTSSYRRIHRLVAEAFVDNPQHADTVNHKDGNKRNNHANNLEWVTAQQNIAHARRMGLRKDPMQGVRRAPVKLQCVQTGAIFDNIKQASESLELSYSYLSDCIHNNKPCHGFTFIRL